MVRHNRLGLSILAILTVVGGSGCALQARSDVDTRASLSSCHSFRFGETRADRAEYAPAFANPLNEKRLRESIQTNLVAHGLQPAAEAALADCAVGYSIGSRLAVDPGYPRVGWGFGLGWGRRGMASSVAWDAGPYDFREGRIAVNLFDAHTHEPLWHAYVDEDVTRLTGGEAEQRINAAVAAIFAKFPGAVGAAPPH